MDTNVVSELMRLEPDDRVLRFVDRVPVQSVWLSSITHAEILQGVALLEDGQRKQKIARKAEQVLALFADKTCSFERRTAPHYASVIRQRRNQGRPISALDAQIAAISLQRQLILVTRNTRDFEGIGRLRLANPWRDPPP